MSVVILGGIDRLKPHYVKHYAKTIAIIIFLYLQRQEKSEIVK